MKQIGLAIHNFHDTQRALPPCSVGYDGATMWVLIYPYIEQQALYDFFATRTTTASTYKGFGLPCNTQWWILDVSEEQKKAISSIPIYFCPSRRSAGAFTVFNASGDNKNQMNASTNPASGPCSDYGMVFYSRYDVTGANWYECTSLNVEYHLTSNFGPFRLAEHQLPRTAGVATDSAVVASWTPRDSMAWWSDGTSNQFLVMEKHIPPSVLGLCDGDGSGTAGTGTSGQRSDCSYVTANGWKSTGSARSFRHGNTYFALSPASHSNDTPWINSAFNYGFGSWHPGICHALMGDASVRPVLNITLTDTLVAFADVSDGKNVVLPQ